MTENERAQVAMARALNRLSASNPDAWFSQTLALLGIAWEKLEGSVSDVAPWDEAGLEPVEMALIDAMGFMGSAMPRDWIPRVVRLILMVQHKLNKEQLP